MLHLIVMKLFKKIITTRAKIVTKKFIYPFFNLNLKIYISTRANNIVLGF